MSQTMEMDPKLAAAVMPPQQLVLDPTYGSVRMVTPVGRFAYVTLVKPRSVEQNGRKSEPKYSVTILLNPNVCADIYRAIAMVANARWPGEQRPNPQNPTEMIVMTGEQMLFLPQQQGGLHYPLRDGKDAYMRDPVKYAAFNGLFSLNASTDAVNQKTGQSMQPVALAENGEDRTPIDRFYSGCYGRLQVTLFPFPKAGQQVPNRGVGVALNAVQFADNGAKLATFDAEKAAVTAFKGVGALPQATPGAAGFAPGFGPNTAGPGSMPPGAVPGFAPPPPQQPQYAQQPQPQYAQQPQPQYAQQPQPQYAQQPQQAPQVPTQPVPPAGQPWQPQAGGARPPGV